MPWVRFLPKPGLLGLVKKRLRESGGRPVVVSGGVYVLVGRKHRKWIDRRPLEELCERVDEVARPPVITTVHFVLLILLVVISGLQVWDVWHPDPFLLAMRSCRNYYVLCPPH